MVHGTQNGEFRFRAHTAHGTQKSENGEFWFRAHTVHDIHRMGNSGSEHMRAWYTEWGSSVQGTYGACMVHRMRNSGSGDTCGAWFTEQNSITSTYAKIKGIHLIIVNTL